MYPSTATRYQRPSDQNKISSAIDVLNQKYINKVHITYYWPPWLARWRFAFSFAGKLSFVRLPGRCMGPRSPLRRTCTDSFAYLHQFEQHFQYVTAFVWKDTDVKRDHLIYTEMWLENRGNRETKARYIPSSGTLPLSKSGSVPYPAYLAKFQIREG